MEIKLLPHQTKVLQSKKSIVALIGGIQCGKSTVGAVFMLKKLCEYPEPENNFIIGAPSYKTLAQSTLPAFMSVCKDYGTYSSQKAMFEFSTGAKVYFRTSTDGDSAEGITNVRGCWLDEGGLVTKYFYENIVARASFKQAQVLITTTPYSLNFLYNIVKDVNAGRRNDVELVTARSIDNTYFPVEEFDRQRGLLDPRRFASKYEGQFMSAEGLVFDCFTEDHVIDPIQFPSGTIYYGAVDWGFRDPTVVIIRAVTLDGKHYDIAEYYRTGMSTSEVVDAVLSRHKLYNVKMFCCDKSRPDYIKELNANGIPAIGVDCEIKDRVAKHYEIIKTNRYKMFNNCSYMQDEYRTYKFPDKTEIDPNRNPRDLDNPVDQNNHCMDATSYLSYYLARFNHSQRLRPVIPSDSINPPKDNMERLKWLKAGGSDRYHRAN